MGTQKIHEHQQWYGSARSFFGLAVSATKPDVHRLGLKRKEGQPVNIPYQGLETAMAIRTIITVEKVIYDGELAGSCRMW